MVKQAKSSKKRKAKTKAGTPKGRGRLRLVLRQGLRGLALVAVLLVLVIAALGFVNPPTTHTIWSEKRRLGSVDFQWVPLDEVAPATVRAVVAAEDANYCLHWGFDMSAIRAALDEGAARGASTITQQTVKNVFLWQERSWSRKALEALITPLVEVLWSKRRILEVYLNVAEFDEGVFGIEAAAHRYFRVSPDKLTPLQGAQLAVVLPNPKGRNAAKLTPGLRRRAAAVADGAATIKADGRSACFEG